MIIECFLFFGCLYFGTFTVYQSRKFSELTVQKFHKTKSLTSTRCSVNTTPLKEVIQPHVLVRLPCYDFTPVIDLTLDAFLRLLGWYNGFECSRLPWCDGRCVQDPGTYSPRHADSGLLANSASCGRVAAHNPNWDHLFGICSTSRYRVSL